ncbi:hypothetical protein EVAR_75968_1 [Eumeta japonica]|uniref:Uncharacterized protein n=1 Tax=Eumeta variegata TaxID=151549 RepID=A0A4C1UA16_EUMVA|nr:hypothetical protein EVAR_75968_1 [Eumeta japonica]
MQIQMFRANIIGQEIEIYSAKTQGKQSSDNQRRHNKDPRTVYTVNLVAEQATATHCKRSGLDAIASFMTLCVLWRLTLCREYTSLQRTSIRFSDEDSVGEDYMPHYHTSTVTSCPTFRATLLGPRDCYIDTLPASPQLTHVSYLQCKDARLRYIFKLQKGKENEKQLVVYKTVLPVVTVAAGPTDHSNMVQPGDGCSIVILVSWCHEVVPRSVEKSKCI